MYRISLPFPYLQKKLYCSFAVISLRISWEVLIQALQFLGQPVAAGKGFVDVEAIGSVGIEHEVKAQVDDEQGMPQQEATQLTSVDEAFVLTDEESFEVGAFGMGRPPWASALGLEVL